jgi:23S rRNA (uracil1939-C5)-methyltransferase
MTKNTIQQGENTVNLKCPHQTICSVCPWLDLPLPEQKRRKVQKLTEHLDSLSISTTIAYFLPSSQKLRERVDLIFENGNLGFYEKGRRQIFSPTDCLVMSPELFSFYQQIKEINFPIRKGSLRLRTYLGKKGLWLDFANEDIKQLFEEKTTLLKILELGAIVEIGQRKKALVWDGQKFSLSKTPRFENWSSTWLGQKEIPLKSLVASFTQSGHVANQVIIERFQKMLSHTTAESWLEFGSGNGNLSFSLLHLKKSLIALEFDEASILGMKESLKEHRKLAEKAIMLHGDFQKGISLGEVHFDGILANPPRSGLKNFLDILEKQKPKDFIYMSCYLESFSMDARRLKELGYQLQEIEIIDQFPHTEHFEILSRFELRN